MGGAIAAFLSSRLEKVPSFKGSILLAPALAASVPHWLIVAALEHSVVMCAPAAEMPTWLSKVNDNTKTWKDEVISC